jgi:hypothetical protein
VHAPSSPGLAARLAKPHGPTSDHLCNFKRTDEAVRLSCIVQASKRRLTSAFVRRMSVHNICVCGAICCFPRTDRVATNPRAVCQPADKRKFKHGGCYATISSVSMRELGHTGRASTRHGVPERSHIRGEPEDRQLLLELSFRRCPIGPPPAIERLKTIALHSAGKAALLNDISLLLGKARAVKIRMPNWLVARLSIARSCRDYRTFPPVHLAKACTNCAYETTLLRRAAVFGRHSNRTTLCL